MQEADRLLAGEGGHGRLLHLRKMLDAKRRELVGHVTSIYPLSTTASQGSSSNHKPNDAVISHPQPSGAFSLLDLSVAHRIEVLYSLPCFFL